MVSSRLLPNFNLKRSDLGFKGRRKQGISCNCGLLLYSKRARSLPVFMKQGVLVDLTGFIDWGLPFGGLFKGFRYFA